MMGFRDDTQEGVLVLQPTDIPRLCEVAVDMLFAQEEIRIIKRVQSHTKLLELSVSDILVGRCEVVWDTDDFAMTFGAAACAAARSKEERTAEQMEVGRQSTNDGRPREGPEAAIEQGMQQKPSCLGLQQQQDSRLMRSQSVGGTPVKGLTTDEFDIMLMNLPAVVPSMPKRTGEVRSHFGQSHDDSDPAMSSLSSSFIARRACMPDHDVYDPSEQTAYGSADEQSSPTKEASEEQPTDNDGLYESGAEDDSADLKSMIYRSRMHESNLSMVEPSGFDDSQLDSPYECDRPETLRRYPPHGNHHLEEQTNETDFGFPYSQPRASDNKHLSSSWQTEQVQDGQPESDANVQGGSSQRPHNSAPLVGADLQLSTSEKGREQPFEDVTSQQMAPARPEVPPRTSSKSAMNRTERSWKEPGQQTSSLCEKAVKLDTDKAVTDADSDPYVVLSMDGKQVTVHESSCTNPQTESAHDKEFESAGNGGGSHTAMSHKTKVAFATEGNNSPCGDDTKPVEADKEKVKSKPTKEQNHSYPAVSTEGAPRSAFVGERPSYAAVLATRPRPTLQQGVLARSPTVMGRDAPGIAQRQPEEPWQCQHCTLCNDQLASICGACHKTRDFQVGALQADGLKPCPSCTLLNPIEAEECRACHQPYDLRNLRLPKDIANGDLDPKSTLV